MTPAPMTDSMKMVLGLGYGQANLLPQAPPHPVWNPYLWNPWASKIANPTFVSASFQYGSWMGPVEQMTDVETVLGIRFDSLARYAGLNNTVSPTALTDIVTQYTRLRPSLVIPDQANVLAMADQLLQECIAASPSVHPA